MTKLNPPKDEKKVAKNAEPTRERKYLDAQLEKEKEGSYFSTSLATTLRYTRTRILRERKKRANKQLPAGKPKEEKKPINPGEAQTKDGLVSRKPTLYDAVAGRVDVKGRVVRDLENASAWPLFPEEVLFRSSTAPIRYEEDDIYFRNEKLPPHQPLPGSDLLKALHAYSSDFYFCNKTADRILEDADADFESMDETALLAMGILMEEAARQRLGETGDMALTEADDEDEGEWPMLWSGREWVKSIIGTVDTRKKLRARYGLKVRSQKRKRGNEEDAEGEARSKRAKTEETPGTEDEDESEDEDEDEDEEGEEDESGGDTEDDESDDDNGVNKDDEGDEVDESDDG